MTTHLDKPLKVRAGPKAGWTFEVKPAKVELLAFTIDGGMTIDIPVKSVRWQDSAPK